MQYKVIVSNKTKFEDWEECFKYLSDLLLQEKTVKPGYWESVYEREIECPTGLQTTTKYGIAIPHPMDPELCVEPSVAVAVLSEPIDVHSMVNPSDTIPVNVVIMLALVSSENHLKMLQKLMETFNDESFIESLQKCQNHETVKSILEEKLRLH